MSDDLKKSEECFHRVVIRAILQTSVHLHATDHSAATINQKIRDLFNSLEFIKVKVTDWTERINLQDSLDMPFGWRSPV